MPHGACSRTSASPPRPPTRITTSSPPDSALLPLKRSHARWSTAACVFVACRSTVPISRTCSCRSPGRVLMSSTDLAPAPVRRYRGAFLRLYRSEVRLLLRRRRNQILVAVLAAIPIFIGVAVKISAPQNGEGPQFIGRITGNGLFLVFTAITVSLPFFLPLIISVVAGDAIAGEAGLGTLRYVLTVPVGRGRLLTVKSLAIATFTAIAVFTVAL